MFHATEALDKKGSKYLRSSDTEYKILNDIATRKEIRAYKKQWGEQGIKVNIDKKGNILPENVEAAI